MEFHTISMEKKVNAWAGKSREKVFSFYREYDQKIIC